jgi:hypothetical protein
LADIKPGTWHNVRNVLSGNIIEIYIDNQLVLTLNVAGVLTYYGAPLTTGTVGFGNEQGAEGLFRNLVVTDPSQNLLYQSTLTDPSILDQFAAGTNILPSIMDGAKRDRKAFTGDIGISGLTLLYSTFAREYLAGSIDLFSSFQASNGGIASSLPPQYHPGVTPPDSTAASVLIIPDYPLQHVTSIYHYYLYTGDKAFLQTQWPVGQKVIALYASLTNNPQHLVIPPAIFGSPSADTLTNAHFYGVLLQGAQLAEAVGHADVAAGYRAAAAQLRQAINTVLYNSTTGLSPMMISYTTRFFAWPTERVVYTPQNRNAPRGRRSFEQGQERTLSLFGGQAHSAQSFIASLALMQRRNDIRPFQDRDKK